MRFRSGNAKAAEPGISGAHRDLRIVMQRHAFHADIASGEKRARALLLPAQHAAPRDLDGKVEDQQEKLIMQLQPERSNSAATTNVTAAA